MSKLGELKPNASVRGSMGSKHPTIRSFIHFPISGDLVEIPHKDQPAAGEALPAGDTGLYGGDIPSKIHLLADRVIEDALSAAGLRNRLILLTGNGHRGKTAVLNVVRGRIGAPLINLNLELSQRLLNLPARQRAQRAARLVHEIVAQEGPETVLLDNTEFLFEPSLQMDPLRLLLDLSRNKTLIVSWNGTSTDTEVSYAHSGHPEHKRYLIKDFLVISTDSGTQT